MCLQIYILLPVPFENSGTLPLCPLVSPLVSKFSPRHPNPFIYKQYGRPTQRHGHRHNPHMHSQMHKHHILMSTNPEDSLYLLSAGLGPWLSLQMSLSERTGLVLPKCPLSPFSMTPVGLWRLRGQKVTPRGGRHQRHTDVRPCLASLPQQALD